MTTVAVVAIGEMGTCLASRLRDAGTRVVTVLEGRGEATRRRAAEIGIEDLPLAAALAEADVFVSVLPPARAVELAERVAAVLTRPLLYVDANAVSPQTALRVGTVIEATGARFVDGGIIGFPPDPAVYLSGPYAADAVDLLAGLRLIDLGGEPGRASALKMCYAAFTKGTTALATELLVAARRLGIDGELAAELHASSPALIAYAERSVPRMPAKAHRWIAEMEEIAATFEAVGLTPRILSGAGDVYRMVEAAGGADVAGDTVEETVNRLSGG